MKMSKIKSQTENMGKGTGEARMATNVEWDGKHAIEVNNLTFGYPNRYGTTVPVLHDVSVKIPAGARVLLLGANGAGKSTILKMIAGKHLHEENAVVVLGHQAFFQTLGLSGITYLGGEWTRTVGYVGNNVPYQADIKVKDLMKHLQDEYPERRDKLYEVLEIDPEWKMHAVSDGQRRRTQIMLGLLRPFKLLLLDELTVDLDVLARLQFLEFLEQECKERNATVIYATHIFDGINDWPSHLLMLEGGRLVRFDDYETIKKEPSFKSLYWFVVDYLKQMQAKRQEEAKKNPNKDKFLPPGVPDNVDSTDVFVPGRMMQYWGS